MNRHAPPSEIEDDGFVTDMSSVIRGHTSADACAREIPGRKSPAIPADGRNAPPPPLTRTERYLASLKSENDGDESRLAAIEAELIAVEESTVSRRRQAEAICADKVRQAEAERDRELRRADEDEAAALDALTDEKGDLSTVVLARHAGIEAIVSAEAGE